jgi:hypothetical protein
MSAHRHAPAAERERTAVRSSAMMLMPGVQAARHSDGAQLQYQTTLANMLEKA